MVICKESSKPSKLSTKLSTIWQINDYLSKKIDNRLIVDIIDTRGHPEDRILLTRFLQLTSGSNIIVMFDRPNFSDLVVSARSNSYSKESVNVDIYIYRVFF